MHGSRSPPPASRPPPRPDPPLPQVRGPRGAPLPDPRRAPPAQPPEAARSPPARRSRGPSRGVGSSRRAEGDRRGARKRVVVWTPRTSTRRSVSLAQRPLSIIGRGGKNRNFLPATVTPIFYFSVENFETGMSYDRLETGLACEEPSNYGNNPNSRHTFFRDRPRAGSRTPRSRSRDSGGAARLRGSSRPV